MIKWDINRDLDRICDYAIACQMEGGGISHAHVVVRVCRGINARMNLSVGACVCPFLTRPLLHFKIRGANDPFLTRSPAERGRVGEGELSLRARRYRTKSPAAVARTYINLPRARVCVGVSFGGWGCDLSCACAHVHKEPPGGSATVIHGGRAPLSGATQFTVRVR